MASALLGLLTLAILGLSMSSSEPQTSLSPLRYSQPSTQQDINVLRERLIAFYVTFGDCTQVQFCLSGGYNLPLAGGSCDATCPIASNVSSLQLPDGSWKDVNYTDQNSAFWHATLHLERALVMARASHCTACDTAKQGIYTRGALSALRFWIHLNTSSPNWWWNNIGETQEVAAISLLVYRHLTQEDLSRVNVIMAHAGNGTQMNGQNMLWMQQAAINGAVLNNNTVFADSLFRLMWSHIRFTTGDGPQADGCFKFHGGILYLGGYGADYALQLVTMAALASGTCFDIRSDAEAQVVLDTYLLQGQQYALRGVAKPTPETSFSLYYDLSSKGREITRPPDGVLLFPAQVFAWSLNSSLFLNSSRFAREYRDFASRLAGHSVLGGSNAALQGTKHFFKCDYTLHHRSQFAFSLKMTSVRTFNNEVVNGEGEQTWHTGAGALMTYRNGSEYDAIFPTWDWQRIPGTISRVNETGENNTLVKQKGATTFAGACVENISSSLMTSLSAQTLLPVGMSALNYESLNFGGLGEESPIRALRAWAWLEEGVVSMTSSISLKTPSTHVQTTVEQSLLRSSVTTDLGSLTEGNYTLNVRWIHHNDILYVLDVHHFAPRSTHIDFGTRYGRWTDINAGASSDLITSRNFMITLDHGASPFSMEANTAYGVFPGVSMSAAGQMYSDLRAGKAFKILLNTPTIQAIEYQDLNQNIAFARLLATARNASSAEVIAASLPKVSVTGSGVFVLLQTSETLIFSASNPDNKAGGILRLEVSDALLITGSNPDIICSLSSSMTTVEISLPSNGSSISGFC